jgi:hypothetical protein
VPLTKTGIASLKSPELPAGERLVRASELRQLAIVEQEVDRLDEQLAEIAAYEPRAPADDGAQRQLSGGSEPCIAADRFAESSA